MLYGAAHAKNDVPESWTMLAKLSFKLAAESTVTLAELEACLWGVAYLEARLRGIPHAARNAQEWQPYDAKLVKL